MVVLTKQFLSDRFVDIYDIWRFYYDYVANYDALLCVKPQKCLADFDAYWAGLIFKSVLREDVHAGILSLSTPESLTKLTFDMIKPELQVLLNRPCCWATGNIP